MTVYEVARQAIIDALKYCKVKDANERSIKKSAYCTSYVVSDGAGEIDDYGICTVQHIWQPIISIMFHNGANRKELHKKSAETKDKVIDEIVRIGNHELPTVLFEFGTPITYDVIEIDDNTAQLNITLNVRAITKR